MVHNQSQPVNARRIEGPKMSANPGLVGVTGVPYHCILDLRATSHRRVARRRSVRRYRPRA